MHLTPPVVVAPEFPHWSLPLQDPEPRRARAVARATGHTHLGGASDDDGRLTALPAARHPARGEHGAAAGVLAETVVLRRARGVTRPEQRGWRPGREVRRPSELQVLHHLLHQLR